MPLSNRSFLTLQSAQFVAAVLFVCWFELQLGTVVAEDVYRPGEIRTLRGRLHGVERPKNAVRTAVPSPKRAPLKHESVDRDVRSDNRSRNQSADSLDNQAKSKSRTLSSGNDVVTSPAQNIAVTANETSVSPSSAPVQRTRQLLWTPADPKIPSDSWTPFEFVPDVTAPRPGSHTPHAVAEHKPRIKLEPPAVAVVSADPKGDPVDSASPVADVSVNGSGQQQTQFSSAPVSESDPPDRNTVAQINTGNPDVASGVSVPPVAAPPSTTTIADSSFGPTPFRMFLGVAAVIAAGIVFGVFFYRLTPAAPALPSVIRLEIQDGEISNSLSLLARLAQQHSPGTSRNAESNTTVVELAETDLPPGLGFRQTFAEKKQRDAEALHQRTAEICKSVFENNLQLQQALATA